MTNYTQNESKCCFQRWMVQQDAEMKKLVHAINNGDQDEEKLSELVQMCMESYEEYHKNRLFHARNDPTSILSPTWCSSFENTNLWIGGCRPTLFIQLTYTLSGIYIESELTEFLKGLRSGNLGELTSEQLGFINDLQRRTVYKEDKLSSMKASVQEEIGSKTLVQMANEWDQLSDSTSDANQVFDSYDMSWGLILEEADKLRLLTLKELVFILTPLQAVELLMAGKKLHISIHEWCKRRELQRV